MARRAQWQVLQHPPACRVWPAQRTNKTSSQYSTLTRSCLCSVQQGHGSVHRSSLDWWWTGHIRGCPLIQFVGPVCECVCVHGPMNSHSMCLHCKVSLLPQITVHCTHSQSCTSSISSWLVLCAALHGSAGGLPCQSFRPTPSPVTSA